MEVNFTAITDFALTSLVFRSAIAPKFANQSYGWARDDNANSSHSCSENCCGAMRSADFFFPIGPREHCEYHESRGTQYGRGDRAVQLYGFGIGSDSQPLHRQCIRGWRTFAIFLFVAHH